MGLFMKKLFSILLIVVCLFLTGCGSKSKVAVSLDNFDTVLTDSDFTVDDNMITYSDVDYITGARIAKYNNISIEMVSYSDNEHAKMVQDKQIQNFGLRKSTGAHEKTEKGDNFYKYFLVSNNRYMISTRVDNTLIFCQTLLENKDTVDKVLEKLGY